MEHLVQEIMESKLEHSFCINNFYEMRLSTIYSWVVYTSRILLAVKFHVFGLTIRKLLEDFLRVLPKRPQMML